MCHDLLEDANLWLQLSKLDRQIAAQVQSQGCPCGAVLHRACYPRKPRGVARELPTEDYESRQSFCCNKGLSAAHYADSTRCGKGDRRMEPDGAELQLNTGAELPRHG